MNALLIGNLGFKNNKIDGQTIKTRTIYSLLQSKYNDVYLIDTSYRTFKNAFLDLYKYFICKEIFVCPGYNGLRFLSPFYYLLILFFRKKIKYVVIGGWLYDLLSKNKPLKYFVSKFDGVYVETLKMKNDLAALGLCNVHVLNNFRITHNSDSNIVSKLNVRPLKLVYCSRIMKEKGIEIATDSFMKLTEAGVPAELHIYGQFDNGYDINYLEKLGVRHCYKGCIMPENVISVLSEYDILLFPTYYYGEGFPGIFIDAFNSGLIIIASDWKYNSEIINNNINGFILDDNKLYVDLLKKLYTDIELFNHIRANSYNSRLLYNQEHAYKVLFP